MITRVTTLASACVEWITVEGQARAIVLTRIMLTILIYFKQREQRLPFQQSYRI